MSGVSVPPSLVIVTHHSARWSSFSPLLRTLSDPTTSLFRARAAGSVRRAGVTDRPGARATSVRSGSVVGR